MIKNIIYQQREERDSLLAHPYIGRLDPLAKAEYLSTGLIKLITGPRRAGKSVMSLQILKDKNFAYLNFDDDLLLKNFNEDLVVQTLNEIYPGYEYLFLDEIQNLPNWELWVNKLYRRGTNLIVTGSNAKLLSHEMATSLTGRYLKISVFPFSFSEFLTYHNATFIDEDLLKPERIGMLMNYLNTYLQNGGFPEIVLNPSILKNYLSSLFDSVLLKDIIRRFQIRHSQQFYDLSNYLLANCTNLFSFNQLIEYLNFNSVASVQKYVRYLSEPYLFICLTRYYIKIKLQKKSQKKSYIIDNGFIQAGSFELSPNYGRLLENVVFVELLRRNFNPEQELFYYKTRNDKEIDFVCRKGYNVEQLIQVCYDIANPKTLKRELDALIEASTELNSRNLLLINWNREEVIILNNLSIRLIPAYKWLCNK